MLQKAAKTFDIPFQSLKQELDRIDEKIVPEQPIQDPVKNVSRTNILARKTNLLCYNEQYTTI